eukprot:6208705-Pleurochrysis_carterae.AAC.1
MPGGHGNVEHAADNALVTGLAVDGHHIAADSLAANFADEGGQLRSCGHGVVSVDAARKDLVGQLGDVALGVQADHARLVPKSVQRKWDEKIVICRFVAQGGAARVFGDDVVDVVQHNQHLLAPDHVKEALVVLGLGEAKLDDGLADCRVPLASGGGVAVHVSNLCNHLAAVLLPPLVALRD